MNNELSQIMNQNLFAPFIFIVMCILLFILLGTVIYHQFLSRWFPWKIASLVGFAGSAYIFITCIKHYEGIKGLVAAWNVTGIAIGMTIFFIILGSISALIAPHKNKRKVKKTNRKMSNTKSQTKRPMQNRTDHEILNSSLENLSGSEFERLLALYFQDQGFKVREVGIGGRDGGVDLVIIDQRGEKIAVQAKCYAKHNSVGVQIVRELVGAKRNHDCILSLLITTSDLTVSAKKEAEQFKVDYWHGGVVEQKLKAWGKWCPSNKSQSLLGKSAHTVSQKDKMETFTSVNVTCSCGAQMILRKGREGKSFWGCVTFPKCRQTKST